MNDEDTSPDRPRELSPPQAHFPPQVHCPPQVRDAAILIRRCELERGKMDLLVGHINAAIDAFEAMTLPSHIRGKEIARLRTMRRKACVHADRLTLCRNALIEIKREAIA